MENSQWDQTELEQYLLYDFWTVDNGLAVMAGKKYDLSGEPILKEEKLNLNLSESRTQKYRDLRGLWESSKHSRHAIKEARNTNVDPIYHEYPSTYIIEWVLFKRFRPDWLDWAIERGLYTPKQKAEKSAQAKQHPVFDTASPTYPPELDIALQAWQEVSATDGKGKPKARITEWLDANTKLSSAAKERIAILANWDKTGGATRTDQNNLPTRKTQ